MKRMLFVILAMAFSTNLPSPMFPLYQAAYGLTTAAITVLFAIYAGGVFAMLLLGGALAERIGALPVALGGVCIAIISSLLFMLARGPALLVAGRALGGLGVGAFLGTSNTLLLAMTTAARRDRVMGLSSTLNLFGFGLGPAVGGIWQRGLPGDPTRVPFAILAAVLAAALLTLLSVSAGRERASAPTRPAIRLGIPASGRMLFWAVVGPGIFTGFAFGGIAFALLPGLVRSMFGTAGRGFAGLLVFLMTTVGALVQLVQAPARSSTRLVWGFIMLGVGSWVMVLGESSSQVLLVLAASLLQGAGNGWAFQASIRLASDVAVRGDRIQVMSTYFLCGYAGLSLPIVAAGELSRAIGVLPSVEINSAFLSVLLLVALAFTRRASAVEASQESSGASA